VGEGVVRCRVMARSLCATADQRSANLLG